MACDGWCRGDGWKGRCSCPGGLAAGVAPATACTWSDSPTSSGRSGSHGIGTLASGTGVFASVAACAFCSAEAAGLELTALDCMEDDSAGIEPAEWSVALLDEEGRELTMNIWARISASRAARESGVPSHGFSYMRACVPGRAVAKFTDAGRERDSGRSECCRADVAPGQVSD
jgi:hypothetical protein